MLLVTTKTRVVNGVPHFYPCIQFNGQVWLHTASYRDENVAYNHGVGIATALNAKVREAMQQAGFELLS